MATRGNPRLATRIREHPHPAALSAPTCIASCDSQLFPCLASGNRGKKNSFDHRPLPLVLHPYCITRISGSCTTGLSLGSHWTFFTDRVTFIGVSRHQGGEWRYNSNTQLIEDFFGRRIFSKFIKSRNVNSQKKKIVERSGWTSSSCCTVADERGKGRSRIKSKCTQVYSHQEVTVSCYMFQLLQNSYGKLLMSGGQIIQSI